MHGQAKRSIYSVAGNVEQGTGLVYQNGTLTRPLYQNALVHYHALRKTRTLASSSRR